MTKLSEKKSKLVFKLYHAACKSRDQNRFDKALLLLDKALSLFPYKTSNFKLIITKGEILESTSNFTKAKILAKKAIKIKPTHPAGWILLGLAHKGAKEYRACAKAFQKVVALKPDFNGYTLLANVELAFDPKAALRDAENALRLNSKWEEAIRIRDKAKALLEEE